MKDDPKLNRRVMAMLSNVLIVAHMRIDDVKYLRYSNGRRGSIILEDVEDETGCYPLSHMVTAITKDDMERLDMTKAALVAWLLSHGAKRMKRRRGVKHPGPLYD